MKILLFATVLTCMSLSFYVNSEERNCAKFIQAQKMINHNTKECALAGDMCEVEDLQFDRYVLAKAGECADVNGLMAVETSFCAQFIQAQKMIKLTTGECDLAGDMCVVEELEKAGYVQAKAGQCVNVK